MYRITPEVNELTSKVIAAAIEVHRELGGPGLVEDVYEEAFVIELEKRALPFRRQLWIPIFYKDRKLTRKKRIDLIIADTLIVECKATEAPNPVFAAQCLTYLRLMNKPLGLVVNFGFPRLADGVERIVNDNYVPE